MKTLDFKLRQIDKKQYGQYRRLRGIYRSPQFHLEIRHVQGDPYAPPSRLALKVLLTESGVDPLLVESDTGRVAVCDFLLRALQSVFAEHSVPMGAGQSGCFSLSAPGQEVLRQTALQFDGKMFELRFALGLPGEGRIIEAEEARRMLMVAIPDIVQRGFGRGSLDEKSLAKHVRCVEEQQHLRNALEENNLLAFLTEGSMLARAAGNSDVKLEKGEALKVPDSLATTLEGLDGPVHGLGISKGVTLIAGGGFHGKSTLLRALERGIYDHIPGDGREGVVCRSDAFKLRAEDGRVVTDADISAFVQSLPGGEKTTKFCSNNASGSTSQASNLAEALDAGTGLLLVDEDISAVNFLVRDARMQALLPADKEPIIPLVDRVRELYRDLGTSAILVIGACGDYLDEADQVLAMVDYQPVDMLEKSREVVAKLPSERKRENIPRLKRPRTREVELSVLKNALDAEKGAVVKSRGKHLISGASDIDLSLVEQLVHADQQRALGWALQHLVKKAREGEGLQVLLDRTMNRLHKDGLDALTAIQSGELAMFRRQDLASVFCRIRNL